jgi:hypothetical protein
MSARNVSFATLFSWIPDSFRLVGRGPGTLAASAALMFVGFVLISIPMWLGMGSAMRAAAAGTEVPGVNPLAGNMTTFLVSYAITLLLSLLVFPPVSVGWFRIMRALDARQPTRATMLFDGFRDAWVRSVLLSLLGLAGLLVVAIALGLALAGPLSTYIQQTTAAQAAILAGGQAQPVLPSGSLVLGYLIFVLLMMVWQFACSIAIGEVALQGAGPVDALGRGIAATLRNVHKLFLFVLILVVAGLVFALVLGLLIAVLMFALSLLGEAAIMVGMFLLYIPLFLLMYPLVFAGMYLAWKSMLGEAPPSSAEAEVVAA